MTHGITQFHGSTRLVRGAVLGGACLLLTEIGHTSAGGGHLDIGTALAAVVALALGCAWAQRRRSVPRMVGFVVSVQVLLHVLLVMSGGHANHHVPLMPGAGVITAHALAAVAVALLLNFGEATVQQWRSFISALVGPLWALPFVATVGPTLTVRPGPARDTTSVLHRQRPRRGPPSI